MTNKIAARDSRETRLLPYFFFSRLFFYILLRTHVPTRKHSHRPVDRVLLFFYFTIYLSKAPTGTQYVPVVYSENAVEKNKRKTHFVFYTVVIRRRAGSVTARRRLDPRKIFHSKIKGEIIYEIQFGSLNICHSYYLFSYIIFVEQNVFPLKNIFRIFYSASRRLYKQRWLFDVRD